MSPQDFAAGMVTGAMLILLLFWPDIVRMCKRDARWRRLKLRAELRAEDDRLGRVVRRAMTHGRDA